MKFHHLNTCSLKVVLGFVPFLFHEEICSSICWCNRSLNLHDNPVWGYVPSIITTRPVKLAWWPTWMEKLACEVFFFLIRHFNQCQSPEPIKAASNVVIAFKWLKSLILWCWHVQKGMGDEDVCVNTQLFSLDGVLRC